MNIWFDGSQPCANHGPMTSDHEILAIDQIVQRLSGTFASIAVQDVCRIVNECHARFIDSRIRTYVPLLVEHAARDRLRMMASSVEAVGGRPETPRSTARSRGGRRRASLRLAFADGKAWTVL